jgi:hypothetical protein
MQYSTQDLISMIVSNNLPAIHAQLVAEGRVSAASSPSANALDFVVREQMNRLDADAFLAWMEQVFDVPLDLYGMHYNELANIKTRTGLSPARYLVSQMRQMMTGQEPEQNAIVAGTMIGRPPRYAWVFLCLALIGAICLLSWLVKLVQRANS